MKKEKRFIQIDLLRILAISLVIIFHTLLAIYNQNSLRKIGFLGISLFFIISGFLLAKKYPRYQKFSKEWFLKRYAKLAPYYYLALILIIILFGAQAYRGNLFGNLFSHFLFIDFLFPKFIYGIIASAWFFVPLLLLYALFPYINKYIKMHKGFLAIAFFISILYRFFSGGFGSFSPLFFLGEFVFGMGFAYGRKKEILIYSLLFVFLSPFMILPFLLFTLIMKFNFKFSKIPTKIAHFIGKNTLFLFLFHESFLYLLLGTWTMYSLPVYFSIPLLSIGIFITILIANKIKNKISPSY